MRGTVKRIQSSGIAPNNLEFFFLRSDREPALSETRFKQGLIVYNTWWWDHTVLCTCRFTGGTLQRGPLGEDWFGTVERAQPLKT